MPKIIKRADYENEPVLVASKPMRRFHPARFQDPDLEEGLLATEEPELSGSGIAEAEAQAERILAEAAERATAITREAMARGYADGKAEGLKAAEEQCRGYLERLAELARSATIDRDEMVRSAEQDLAALALEIASKVLRREVAADPSVVLTMVESALEKVGGTDSVRILVHPEDAELVRERWSDLRGAVAFGANWEVIGDERVDRGGCIIETKSGMVDSRIEAQLAEIVTAFEVGQ